MVDNAREAAQRRRAEQAGQGHLFGAWGQLDEGQRDALLELIEGIDFAQVAQHAALLGQDAEPASSGGIEAPELFGLDRSPQRDAEAAEAAAHGERLLRENRVGYLLVAGGQASRLGYDGPKGAFPLGPLSGYTLFEYHARRLLAARARYGCRTPWYVMTSPANHEATVECFEANDHFGLPAGEILFFPQRMIPAVDFEGRILMSAPDRPFLAPNGHGGSIAAFADSGALDHARELGVEHISYFQVDNPLARPADPLFLGLHARARAGMSSKVVAKTDPDEKVGVLGKVGGRMGCIEYSDLPAELRNAREADGQLTFRAGNIAIHLLRLDFLGELSRGGLQLPWHVARKEMQVHTPEGPARVQGAKFETFVFDALGKSASSVTLEVARELEFSPVKNREGSDSPATSRRDLCRLHAAWAERAGLRLPAARLEGAPLVEVDPCLAEDEDQFLERVSNEPPVPQERDGGHLYR